jgi:mRNA-degrading endonuclease RelE of RelBE toxin-antitoxin system
MIPEEENEFVREHFVYNYRLIYEIQANLIYILAVVHAKRMLYPDLKQRFKK